MYDCIADRSSNLARPAGKSKAGPGEKRASGNRVLLIGRFRELAPYRAEVLGGHGFRVLTPQTLEEAILDSSQSLGCAILSYALSSEAVEELTQVNSRVLPQLSADCDFRHPAARLDRRIDADETVIADEGPAALIAALRHVTRRH